MTTGLFENLDCLGIQVPDIEAALKFYQEKLGQCLLWRTPTSAGLAFSQAAGVPELVLHVNMWHIEAAIKVRSVVHAIEQFVSVGGSVVKQPSEIAIGRLAGVADPWGNHLVLLDSTKGQLQTDDEHNVVGVGPAASPLHRAGNPPHAPPPAVAAHVDRSAAQPLGTTSKGKGER